MLPRPENLEMKHSESVNVCFFKTFSTNLFCCQGFKHTKDKWIQKIASLHVLEITVVLRQVMTSLNETVLLFFFLKRQIWHIDPELHTNQTRTATVNTGETAH